MDNYIIYVNFKIKFDFKILHYSIKPYYFSVINLFSKQVKKST